MTSSDSRNRRPVRNVDSPNDTARNYARFIPREELGGFAAWQPGNLAGGPAPQQNVQRPQEEAPPVDVAAEIAAQVKVARQAAYQEGYRDGLAALENFKQN